MSEEKFSYVEFGWGILTGLILGSVLGLIFAPSAGRETRRRIVNYAGSLKVTAGDLIEQARKSLEEASRRLEGLIEGEERRVKKGLKEVRQALERLELEKGETA